MLRIKLLGKTPEKLNLKKVVDFFENKIEFVQENPCHIICEFLPDRDFRSGGAFNPTLFNKYGYWKIVIRVSDKAHQNPNGTYALLPSYEEILIHEILHELWYSVGFGTIDTHPYSRWTNQEVYNRYKSATEKPMENYFYPFLSQTDERWKDLKLGNTNSTIGKFGCALTCLAMLALYFGKDTNPAKLNEELKKTDGYDKDLIKWFSITRIYLDIKYKGSVTCEKVAAPIKEIDKNLPCIAVVDASSKQGLQKHFIVLWAKRGDDYLMSDPLEKKLTMFFPKYGHPFRYVYGLRYFTHTSPKQEEPIHTTPNEVEAFKWANLTLKSEIKVEAINEIIEILKNKKLI